MSPGAKAVWRTIALWVVLGAVVVGLERAQAAYPVAVPFAIVIVFSATVCVMFLVNIYQRENFKQELRNVPPDGDEQ